MVVSTKAILPLFPAFSTPLNHFIPMSLFFRPKHSALSTTKDLTVRL